MALLDSFWMFLLRVFADIFRGGDIGGWVKAPWTVFVGAGEMIFLNVVPR